MDGHSSWVNLASLPLLECKIQKYLICKDRCETNTKVHKYKITRAQEKIGTRVQEYKSKIIQEYNIETTKKLYNCKPFITVQSLEGIILNYMKCDYPKLFKHRKFYFRCRVLQPWNSYVTHLSAQLNWEQFRNFLATLMCALPGSFVFQAGTAKTFFYRSIPLNWPKLKWGLQSMITRPIQWLAETGWSLVRLFPQALSGPYWLL